MGHRMQAATDGPGARPPMDIATADVLARTLQVLTSSTRLRLLDHLRIQPLTVGELATAVEMDVSAVSHQLRLMRDVGVVTATRSGRNMTYAIFDDHVGSLIQQALHHAEHVRLAAIANRAGKLQRAL